MKLVTAANCREIYDMLAGIPPIRGWRLPPSDAIEIKVRAMKDCFALYEPEPHTITLSTLKNGHLDTLVRSIAHEMVHMKLYIKGDAHWHGHEHSFTELADSVCDLLGFDPKEF